MKATAALMCAALLALTGCKSNTDTHGAVTSGTVIGKRFIPTTETGPECWRLTLEDKYHRIGYVCVENSQDWEDIVVSDPLPDNIGLRSAG